MFSTVACSAPNPKDTVTVYLDSLKNGNNEESLNYLKSDSDESLKEVFANENDATDEAFKKAYSKLEYNILNSEVDGGKAVVETEINAPDLGTIMAELFKEIIPLAFANAFNEDASDDEMDKLMDTMLIDKLNSDDIPMVKKTININLVKEEGQWLIEPDDDFYDAITGNLSSITKLFEEEQ